MIAGQFGLLSEPADEHLKHYHDQTGRRALEVEDTQTYLDDDELAIQCGQVAGDVTKQEERVTLDGHEIETETRDVSRRVASEWVADVDGEGWILAERTHSSDLEHEPPWPFNDFETYVGREIAPMYLKPWEFVRRQRDAGREYSIEMATKEYNSDDVKIDWGKDATKSVAENADVGVALTTFWNGVHVRLVIYASGYLAIWEPAEMNPKLLGKFITEEIVPIVHYGEDALEEETDEQATLENEEARA